MTEDMIARIQTSRLPETYTAIISLPGHVDESSSYALVAQSIAKIIGQMNNARLWLQAVHGCSIESTDRLEFVQKNGATEIRLTCVFSRQTEAAEFIDAQGRPTLYSDINALARRIRPERQGY
jgi:hypothetical protein